MVEFTKAGYPHYHVLFDRYLPVSILANHWRHAINIVCHSLGYNGSVNAKGIKTHKNAASYVVKYVLKTATEFEGFLDKYFDYKRNKLKLYTKSSLMKLFHPYSTIDHWEFIILPEFTSSAYLTCKPLAQLPEDLALFYSNIPPPSEKFIKIESSKLKSIENGWSQLEIQYQDYLNN